MLTNGYKKWIKRVEGKSDIPFKYSNVAYSDLRVYGNIEPNTRTWTYSYNTAYGIQRLT